jgi:hypothetical protein
MFSPYSEITISCDCNTSQQQQPCDLTKHAVLLPTHGKLQLILLLTSPVIMDVTVIYTELSTLDYSPYSRDRPMGSHALSFVSSPAQQKTRQSR